MMQTVNRKEVYDTCFWPSAIYFSAKMQIMQASQWSLNLHLGALDYKVDELSWCTILAHFWTEIIDDGISACISIVSLFCEIRVDLQIGE